VSYRSAVAARAVLVGSRCRTYSKGNRQKVALVAALASDAELLVLDEPTSGLDPLMEAVFSAAVAEESARGRTQCCCPATSCPRSRTCAIG
jgi:ABC-type multidrug transport system ATPase subunit